MTIKIIYKLFFNQKESHFSNIKFGEKNYVFCNAPSLYSMLYMWRSNNTNYNSITKWTVSQYPLKQHWTDNKPSLIIFLIQKKKYVFTSFRLDYHSPLEWIYYYLDLTCSLIKWILQRAKITIIVFHQFYPITSPPTGWMIDQ